MSAQQTKHASALPRLREICADLRLGNPARALMREELEPLAYVRSLHSHGLHSDAIQVLARLFPKREAVWWACQCARQSVGDTELPESSMTAVAATEAWVADPSEENRRPLFEAAQRAKLDTAAGCAAMAAFGSGGSMVPPEYDPVYPEDGMTAQLVAGSVLMAGVGVEQDPLESYRVFVEQGVLLLEQSSESL